jgi:hypothetical protein
LNQRFRAFDTDTANFAGSSLSAARFRQVPLGYAAKGKQYICVMTGDNLAVPGLLGDTNFAGVTPEFKVTRGTTRFTSSYCRRSASHRREPLTGIV